MMPVSGVLTAGQDGRRVCSARGVGTIISMGTAAHMWQPGAAQVFIMSIFRAGMEGRLGGLPPCAAPVPLGSGLGRVVREMVWQVFEERANLTANEFDAVCERLVDLLCIVLLGDDRADVGRHHGEVEAMVRRYVREHAHEPGLTGTVVARELGWSLRQVQAVLKKAGTTSRDLIREERLQLARRRLESPAHQNHTIASLAYACGFRSASALSTAFRERFGIRPRDMRR
jgi:AraC-like DNA-binding protein